MPTIDRQHLFSLERDAPPGFIAEVLLARDPARDTDKTIFVPQVPYAKAVEIRAAWLAARARGDIRGLHPLVHLGGHAPQLPERKKSPLELAQLRLRLIPIRSEEMRAERLAACRACADAVIDGGEIQRCGAVQCQANGREIIAAAAVVKDARRCRKGKWGGLRFRVQHPLFVSFFTPENGYAAEAAELVKTLKAFGLDYEVTSLSKSGGEGWQSITHHKPKFLLRMMEENPGRPIVWLDADARVRQYPALLAGLKCDLAAHWKDGNELLSGTLYLGSTEEAKSLLRLWMAENAARPDLWDQKNLQAVLDRHRQQFRIHRLPAPYTLIFDTMKSQGPAVIEHLQASRRLKNPSSSPTEKSVLWDRAGKPLDLSDLYRGQSVFLIAGGPSFGALDHSLLKQPGIMTWGMNNAPKTFRPNLWSCVDAPGTFLRSIWMDPTILKFVPFDQRDGKVFDSDAWRYTDRTAKDCPATVFYKRNMRFDAERFLAEETVNWGCDEANGGGRSVLLATIRLMYLLGFRTIYLLGVDFNMSPAAKYHFPQDRDESSIRGNQGTYQKLKERFGTLRPIFEAAGLQVLNCNPASELKAFEHLPFEEAVSRARAALPADLAGERTEGMYDVKKG